MISSERDVAKYLKSTGLGIIFAGTLLCANDQSPQEVTFSRSNVDFCTPNTPGIIFEAPHTQRDVNALNKYIERLPEPLRNILARDHQQILLLSSDAVKSRYGSFSANVGSYYSPRANEVVLDNSLNFPHEVAHAIDYRLGVRSLSEDFLSEPVNEYNNAQIELNAALLLRLKAQRENEKELELKTLYDKLIANNEKNQRGNEYIQNALTMPYPVRSTLIKYNLEALDVVNHMFVDGFQAFYFPEMIRNPQYRIQYPATYAYFEKFNQTLDTICK